MLEHRAVQRLVPFLPRKGKGCARECAKQRKPASGREASGGQRRSTFFLATRQFQLSTNSDKHLVRMYGSNHCIGGLIHVGARMYFLYGGEEPCRSVFHRLNGSVRFTVHAYMYILL
jgi:hypothetical protein